MLVLLPGRKPMAKSRIYFVGPYWDEFIDILKNAGFQSDTRAVRLNPALMHSHHIQITELKLMTRIDPEDMRHRACYKVTPNFVATAKLLSNNPEALHQWLLGN
jgi:hypothetical protein